MKLTVKNWDFTNSEKMIDIPNFTPDFGIRHMDLMGAEYLPYLEKDIISQVIKWQLAKKRSGNSSTKTRSDVSGTTRKPWAQKETGKSRQGSLRSPHFRGGGVVFGPHPRSYEYKLNKKFKKLALGLIMNQKIKEENVFIFNSFESNIVKTKNFSSWLSLNNLKSVLFVGDMRDSIKKSFSNVHAVDVLPLIGLNVLSCVQHEKIIFDLDAIEGLIARYLSGIVEGEKNA